MRTSFDKNQVQFQEPSASNNTVRPCIAALCSPQWTKNLLIFVPLITSHRFKEVGFLSQATAAYLAFTFSALAMGLFLAITALPASYENPGKTRYPFTSRTLPGAMVAVLLVLAALLCTSLPSKFSLVLALYLTVSLFHSLFMKRVPLADVLILGGLYTLRILAGCPAISVSPSFWLLAFSMFFFLSLALLKHYIELNDVSTGGEGLSQMSGYTVSDLAVISKMGLISGYVSVLVLAFYINSREILVLYSHRLGFWGLCILVCYWISRIWLLAHRREIHGDPLSFAITDRTSLAIASLCIFITFFSI